MNHNDLMDAMGGIRDEFILEAVPGECRPIPFYVKYRKQFAMAASLMIVVGLAGFGLQRFGGTVKNPLMETAMATEVPDMASFAGGIADSGAEDPWEGECDSVAQETFVLESMKEESLEHPAAPEEESERKNGFADSIVIEGTVGNAAAEDTDEELEMAIVMEILLWHNDGFRMMEYVSELPDGFFYEGETGTEESALVRTANGLLTGCPVFLSSTDITAIYVAYPAGYARYEQIPAATE